MSCQSVSQSPARFVSENFVTNLIRLYSSFVSHIWLLCLLGLCCIALGCWFSHQHNKWVSLLRLEICRRCHLGASPISTWIESYQSNGNQTYPERFLNDRQKCDENIRPLWKLRIRRVCRPCFNFRHEENIYCFKVEECYLITENYVEILEGEPKKIHWLECVISNHFN